MPAIDDLKTQIELIGQELSDRLRDVGDQESLESFRIEYLGRKGRVSELFRALSQINSDQRPYAGKLLNALKDEAHKSYRKRQGELQEAKADQGDSLGKTDLTLPGTFHLPGHLHLLTQVQQEIESFFLRIGFDVVTGPEVETEYYNFEALNIPADHPAREEWDSFYVDDTHLLRPHTSPVQIRVMKDTSPPVRIICPGRCYRRDSQDATHSPVFHQVELLWVEEGLSLANLKYIIELFVREFFGDGYEMRVSGDFFPFTEPSVQVHMRSHGSSDWLELGGAGMVDPAVLKEVGYDTELYTGFAFGLGIERMAMLRHGIDDIRVFLTNDLRFIRQF